MIFDKILPASLVLIINGDAVKEVIPGDYGIESIKIVSREYSSDLSAFEASDKIIQYICANLNTEADEVKFNPEFFPSIPQPEVSESQLILEEEAIEKALDGKQIPAGAVPIIITTRFCAHGDYVEVVRDTRGDNFSVNAMICANPTQYIDEKKKAMEYEDNFPKPNTIVGIH